MSDVLKELTELFQLVEKQILDLNEEEKLVFHGKIIEKIELFRENLNELCLHRSDASKNDRALLVLPDPILDRGKYEERINQSYIIPR